MRVAVMQPYFFPYLGYWQLLYAAEVFVCLDDVNFIKRGYINRNNILVNNKPHLLTLALEKASQNSLITEIKVGQNADKILKTVELAYRKAPYFTGVFDLICGCLNDSYTSIGDANHAIITEITNYLGINTKLLKSSDLEIEESLKGQERIIAIVESLKGSHYINPIGGKALYGKSAFECRNITLNFIESEFPNYKQFDEKTFVSHLSIIDIMMFNSRDEVSSMLTRFKLV